MTYLARIHSGQLVGEHGVGKLWQNLTISRVIAGAYFPLYPICCLFLSEQANWWRG